MKNYLLLFVLTLIGIMICACGEDDDEETYETFIYPLEIGNRWEYERKSTWYYYDDDDSTAENSESEIHTSYSAVTVDGLVYVYDSLEVYELSSRDVADGHEYTGAAYYRNEPDGLYIYESNTSTQFMPKALFRGKIRFRGYEFESVRQFLAMMEGYAPIYYPAAKFLTLHDKPLRAIEYPINVGNQWTYRENFSPFRMDKMVTAHKTIEFPVGNYSCYEVRTVYDMDHDGVWDDDFWIVDLISEVGLMERTLTALGVRNTVVSSDSIGFSDEGFIDIYDVRSLTSVEIK